MESLEHSPARNVTLPRSIPEPKLITADLDFLAFLSHELRTPLSSILGYAEMMYDSHQTVTERLGCIAKIRDQVREITGLLKGITELSELESGSSSLAVRPFDLFQEMAPVLFTLRSQAWKRRIQVELVATEAFPRIVHSDPNRLKEILLQMVSGALEHADRGTVRIQVRGIHSPEAEREGILEWKVSTVGLEGSGREHALPVGTQIAKRLARTLGGDLQSASPQGGYVLTIAAGRSGVTEWSRELSWDALKAVQPATPTSRLASLTGVRVLVVDDSEDSRALVQHFLTRSGATVDLAINGLEGWRRGQQGEYDIILMDLDLPELDGLKATQHLRAAGITTPIVALTAHAMESVRNGCFEAGCNAYITKPITADSLMELVGSISLKHSS